ncbi:MAG TPA: Gfo/Idh/MocA family oxidoreductase [Planctomycetaceae bacterium]|nr:Gfo/Idh/MocA family oxidoreductase [Planctomycetaceae bacterium]
MHKVVVIGVGSIGERHVRCFQGTGRASVSIIEINEALRTTIAKRYGVAAYASLKEALAQGPTAAVVAAPAHTHIPLTSQLVTAGLHVLIEKPLSVSLEGIDSLRRLIAERRTVVGLAYVYRAHPVLNAMKQALDANRIGRPLELVVVCGQHFPTYRPAYREIYYTCRELGGGAIQDALTHVVNAGEWLVGPVDSLVADADHCALAGVTVEDTVHLLTRQGKVLGSYSLNQHQAPNELTLTVIGERGTLRWENHRNRLSWLNVPGEEWQEEQFGPLERDSLFVSQAHAFLDAVEGRQPVLCSFDEGLQTLRVNLATLATGDQRCWQTVSPR